MPVEKLLDPWQRVDEVLREVGKWDFADHDEQRHMVLDDGGELVWRVADAFVVGDCDAPVAAAVFEPLLVGTVLREEVVVTLDGQAGGREDFWEAFA